MFPEVRNLHILLIVRRGLLAPVDFEHELIAEELDGFAIASVVLPALRAETMTTLHSLRLAVYNLWDVVAQKKKPDPS